MYRRVGLTCQTDSDSLHGTEPFLRSW